MKRIDAKQFREAGYLQELNRQFLHPLGLALEVLVHEDGTEEFGEVWDSRRDPEGFRFGRGELDPIKADRIEEEQRAKADNRLRLLGYVVQPVWRH